VKEKDQRRNRYFFASSVRNWLFEYLKPIQPNIYQLSGFGGLQPWSSEYFVRAPLEHEARAFLLELEIKFDPPGQEMGILRVFYVPAGQEKILLHESTFRFFSTLIPNLDANGLPSLSKAIEDDLSLEKIVELMTLGAEAETDKYLRALHERDNETCSVEELMVLVNEDIETHRVKGYLHVSTNVINFFKLRFSQLKILELEASKKIDMWPIAFDAVTPDEKTLDSWSRDLANQVWLGIHPQFDRIIDSYSVKEFVPPPKSIKWGFLSFLSILVPPFLLLTLPIYFAKKREEAKSYIPRVEPLELLSLRRSVIQEMEDFARYYLSENLNKKLNTIRNLKLSELSSLVGHKWQPLAAPPTEELQNLTPEEAEHACRQFLLFLGATGAEVTRFSRDGGVDVEADLYVAQVKHQEGAVGVKVVREIAGVARSRKKTPIVFAKRNYTDDARKFADDGGVLLFAYLPSLRAYSSEAKRALEEGLTERFV
jgi:hypothetical protein